MLAFAIESSSQVAGAAIVDENKVISECTLNRGLTHSEVLMTLVDNVFKMGNVDISDIDIFAVSKGPGSFTGLRIGIATTKGLAQAMDKPVVGVPTLDGLAYNIQYTPHTICPILNARRDQVYTSIYEYEGDKLNRVEDYMAIPLDELMERFLSGNKKTIFVGDGVGVYRDKIKDKMGDKALFAPAPFREQRPSSIASIAIDLADRGLTEDFRYIKPFYLRKSQAERVRDRQKNKKG